MARPRGADPVRKVSKKKNVPVAVRLMGEGTFQRGLIDTNAGTWVADTEYDISAIRTNLVASGADKVFPWVRFKVYVFSTAVSTWMEWMLYKLETGAALPDFDNSAEIEADKKRGRIFGHGTFFQMSSAISAPIPIKGLYRNIKLIDGEELRLVLKPATAAAATVESRGIIEFTEVVM